MPGVVIRNGTIVTALDQYAPSYGFSLRSA
jgi:hypothetical protein